MSDQPKTDPMSAAWAFRAALEEIAKAPSLAAAQKRARTVLAQVQIDPPRAGHISVDSGFGMKHQQPFVTLSATQKATQLSVNQAREVAQNILDQAAMAEQDGALFVFFAQQMHMEPQKIAAIITHLRSFRARFRPDLAGLGLADNEEAPPAPPAA